MLFIVSARSACRNRYRNIPGQPVALGVVCGHNQAQRRLRIMSKLLLFHRRANMTREGLHGLSTLVPRIDCALSTR